MTARRHLLNALSRALHSNQILAEAGSRCPTHFDAFGASKAGGPAFLARCISSARASLAITELMMPALSPTMEQGSITKWNVKEGQAFSAGDLLAEVETDKATVGWESLDDGVMGKILKAEGSQNVAVGSLVALVVDEESELASLENYKPGGAPAPQSSSPPPAPKGGDDAKPASKPASSFPPHAVWNMPALSPTMETGVITKWSKQVGDEISEGDVLVEVETDKATMQWESVESGFVAKILLQDGAQGVKVGQPAVVVVEDASLVPAFASFTAEDAAGGGGGGGAPPPPPAPAAEEEAPKAEAKPAAKAPEAPKPTRAPAPTRGAGERVIASPYARKRAAEAGVSLAGIAGSGPGGRIIAADVEAAIADGSAAQPSADAAGGAVDSEWTDVKVNQIKKVTAKRLLESKTTVPHYYLSVECEIDELMALRAQLNKLLEKQGAKISVNDFLIKASALALKDVPEVNSSWHGDFIRQYTNVDISVAVQTPAGLMVPIVRDADIKGLKAISEEVKALAGKAKAGKLQPNEFTGGTFTISNLGMYGVKSFAAIVNPPQSCILACGGADKKVVRTADGSYREVSTMIVTISCDHRVVDGAIGATWLQAFKGYIEKPQTMML